MAGLEFFAERPRIFSRTAMPTAIVANDGAASIDNSVVGIGDRQKFVLK